MSSSILARLDAARRERFVGRDAEVNLFRSALAVNPPPFNILYIFGPAGIGKTTLLREFAYIAKQANASVVQLDGRNVPPSPEAFQDAVAQAHPSLDPDDQTASKCTVLLVDTYERLLPLDGWLRDKFLPQLPGQFLIVLAGRQPPALGWRADPGWRTLVKTVPLRNLDPEASQIYLNKQQIPLQQHARILRFTHGHPLALSLVAESFAQQAEAVPFYPEEAPDIVKTLLAQFLRTVPTPAHQAALEACALVRTLTEPLLTTLLQTDEAQGQQLFDWLRQLSFIEAGKFGIYPHELARQVLAADLRWRNRQQYSHFHQQARQYYQQQIDDLVGKEQTRAIFDYVFLHRNNPIIRPYFEWESSDIYTDVFQHSDLEAILDIIEKHEGKATAVLAQQWLQHQPEGVNVFRDGSGQIQGVLVTIALEKTTPAERQQDSAIQAAWAYLAQTRPLRPGERATYFRFWMGVDSYQSVSPTQSHIFLHMVQHYLTTPGLAFTFLPCADPLFWLDAFAYVDLARIEAADFRIDDKRFGVFGHDWRAVPPLTWLALMADRELATNAEPAPTRTPEPLVVLSETEFKTAVRHALRHFTNVRKLAANGLLRSRLVVEQLPEEQDVAARTAVLRSILEDSLNTLQKSPRQLKQYRALYHTYIQPAPSQEKAAELLDLPFSTYRRHLKSGVETLTTILWQEELGEL